MTTLRAILLLLALTLTLLGGALTLRVDAQGGTPLAVVISASSPIDSLSLSELRRAFLGQSVEKHGVTLVPLNHPVRTPERTLFDRTVLLMTPEEVGRYWVAERIRGGRLAPKSTPSSALLLKVVAKVPGAISYVPSASLQPGLKIVRIDGRIPSEAGYALK